MCTQAVRAQKSRRTARHAVRRSQPQPSTPTRQPAQAAGALSQVQMESLPALEGDGPTPPPHTGEGLKIRGASVFSQLVIRLRNCAI